MKDSQLPETAETIAELTEEELHAASGGQSDAMKLMAMLKGLPFEVDPYGICEHYVCSSCGHTGTGPASRPCLFLLNMGAVMAEDEIHSCSSCKYFKSDPSPYGFRNPLCTYLCK